MIDIHSHILPDLDDGARDLAESVEMARIAAEDGITHMVATPHMYNGLSPNPGPDEVVDRLKGVQKEIGDSLTLLPGNEVHIAHDLVEKLAAGKLTPVNRKSYMLVEFPSMNIPLGAEDIFYSLQLAGVTPILVHPERNRQIQSQPSLVPGFIDKGVRIQITAMSVTGGFGPAARQCAQVLLRHRCVHFLATDTHRATRRPPILSAGRDAAAEIVGEDAARRLVETNPRAVIEGEVLATESVVPFGKEREKGRIRRFFRD